MDTRLSKPQSLLKNIYNKYFNRRGGSDTEGRHRFRWRAQGRRWRLFVNDKVRLRHRHQHLIIARRSSLGAHQSSKFHIITNTTSRAFTAAEAERSKLQTECFTWATAYIAKKVGPGSSTVCSGRFQEASSSWFLSSSSSQEARDEEKFFTFWYGTAVVY